MNSGTGINAELMNEIINYAKKYDIKKLVLFGSRARGDYRKTSDIDLAFSGGEATRFILSVSEDTHTLLEFDIVDLNSDIGEELRKSIGREGIVLYEKV